MERKGNDSTGTESMSTDEAAGGQVRATATSSKSESTSMSTTSASRNGRANLNMAGTGYRNADGVYEPPVHANAPPQGWTSARKLKNGTGYSCFRCFRQFTTRQAWHSHMYVKRRECPKYVENRAQFKAELKSREMDTPKHPPTFEDNIDELDPDSDIFQVMQLRETLPCFFDLGYADFYDPVEYRKRHDEFMLKENVETRSRDQKVNYSWKKDKKSKK